MLTIKCLVEQYIKEYKNWKSVIYVEVSVGTLQLTTRCEMWSSDF